MPKSKKDYSVHNKLNKDPKLSLKAKGLMFYLLSKSDNWKGQIYDIGHHCTDGKKSIMSAVRELKARGYLKTVATTNEDGLFNGKHYEIIHEK